MENSLHTKKLIAIGVKISQLRLERNLTQQDLAIMCEIDVRSIQRIEKGKQNFTLKNLFQLANSFQINATEILEEI